MKGKKRFIAKFFEIFLVIISIALLTSGIAIANVIFDVMQNEQEIKSNYEERKQKCEMLQEIASSTIQEGICINTGKISDDEIKYQIYNDNENIIFYYYFPDDLRSSPKYNATITLSKDYKILKEEYSIEIESFDEYVKMSTRSYKFLLVVFIISCAAIFCLFIFIFKMIISILLKKYKKNCKK